MELKKIILNNIRSYENQEIEFPKGSILLSGNIGSGKTSILLAIEFALFGLQPGQRGSSLLRNGEKQGGVIMDFEVDGKEITIERTLKKGKSISQDYCSINIDNQKKELSVTELKNKVLELLNYPREFSKKQNILYKFTVYTPQEGMKQIILQDSETRINTLRHVFGIDKYKRILENISIVISKIKEERRLKEGMTSNLEKDKESIVLKESELVEKKQNLSLLEKEFFLKSGKRKKIQDEKQEVSKKIEEKIKLQQEIEKTKIMIANKKEFLLGNQKTTEQLNFQIKELEQIRFDESEILKREQEILSKNEQKKELNEKNLQISSKMNSLSLKNQENEDIKNRLSQIELCPTCLQDVDSSYKANVLNQLDSNTSQNVSKINSLILEKKSISTKISKMDIELSLVQKQIQELNFLKIKLQGLGEKQNRLKELENSKNLLEKDTELLNQHVESLRKIVFGLSKVDNLFEIKKKELEESQREEQIAEIKVAELKREIDVFFRQIEELKERVNQTERLKSQLDYLINLENWLSNKFVPVISFIEKNVMVKLKSEFSKLFAEWFEMLVSDSFNVRLDDNFTPIIELQDYEIEYAYLSGGERTAIALAYRLALNQVINSLMSKIKTRDLVILDEPTDGFSDQQLDKMRDVLQELDVKQLIIVSHEQKIEGFVENVIRFKKENGVSGKDE
jgi:exonuclease SbcC